MNFRGFLALFVNLFFATLSNIGFCKDTLEVNEILYPGQSLTSASGQYILDFRADGLLHLRKSDGSILKAFPGGAAFATLQDDGNFVLASPANTALWATYTQGCCTSAARKYVQINDDGELSVVRVTKDGGMYVNGQPRYIATEIWALGTRNTYTGDGLYPGQSLSGLKQITSKNGQFKLMIRGNGSLETFRSDSSLTRSFASGVTSAVMQTDGNFVAYNASGVAVWNTETWNCCVGNIAYLKISDYGDVQLFREGRTGAKEVLWEFNPVTLAPALPVISVPVPSTPSSGTVKLTPPGERPSAPGLWIAPFNGDGLTGPARYNQ